MYKVNLLPPELMSWNKKVDKHQLVVILLVSIITATILISYGTFIYHAYSTRKDLEAIESRLPGLKMQSDQVKQLKEKKDETAKTIQAFEKIIEEKHVWGAMLDDIGLNMPVDIWLTGLKIVNDKNYPGQTIPTGQQAPPASQTAVDNKGVPQNQTPSTAQANQSPPPGQPVNGAKTDDTLIPDHPNVLILEGISGTTPSVGVFQKNLTGLNYFSSVNLQSMEENDDGGFKFTIIAVLKESDTNAAKTK